MKMLPFHCRSVCKRNFSIPREYTNIILYCRKTGVLDVKVLQTIPNHNYTQQSIGT